MADETLTAALRSALLGFPIDSGPYETCVSAEEATAMAEALLPLIRARENAIARETLTKYGETLQDFMEYEDLVKYRNLHHPEE